MNRNIKIVIIALLVSILTISYARTLDQVDVLESENLKLASDNSRLMNDYREMLSVIEGQKWEMEMQREVIYDLTEQLGWE